MHGLLRYFSLHIVPLRQRLLYRMCNHSCGTSNCGTHVTHKFSRRSSQAYPILDLSMPLRWELQGVKVSLLLVAVDLGQPLRHLAQLLLFRSEAHTPRSGQEQEAIDSTYYTRANRRSWRLSCEESTPERNISHAWAREGEYHDCFIYLRRQSFKVNDDLTDLSNTHDLYIYLILAIWLAEARCQKGNAGDPLEPQSSSQGGI